MNKEFEEFIDHILEDNISEKDFEFYMKNKEELDKIVELEETIFSDFLKTKTKNNIYCLSNSYCDKNPSLCCHFCKEKNCWRRCNDNHKQCNRLTDVDKSKEETIAFKSFKK